MPRRSARLAKKKGQKRKRIIFEEHESEEEYNPQSSDLDDIDISDTEGFADTDTLSEDLDELNKYKCRISSDEAPREPQHKKRKIHSSTSKKEPKINSLDSKSNTTKHKRAPNKYSITTGGGFSTKQKALRTLEFIKGRDLRYQINMVSSFLCGARCILKKANDTQKQNNIKEAIAIFEEWTKEYEANKHNLENFDHLPLDIIKKYQILMDYYNTEERKKEEIECDGMHIVDVENTYLNVFEGLNGEIRALRMTQTEGKHTVSWDIYRNNKLSELKQQLMNDDIRCNGRKMKDIDDCLLYYKRGKLKGFPSRLHLQMIMYGYSPYKSSISKLAKNVNTSLNDIKNKL